MIALRYRALLCAGVACGVAGTYLSVAQSAGFINDMTAGKGYIALAALIFGKWRPVPAMLACLLFGFLDAVAIRLQGADLPGIGEVPVQLVQALPYVLTVVLLAGFIGRAAPPKALGLPVRKGAMTNVGCNSYAMSRKEGRTSISDRRLQKLADALGLGISVCHFPPGTSKWNKIEHRMFCHITENWRGRPLVSHEVVVNLIGATTTKGGLAIRSELDEGRYLTGRQVSDEQMDTLSIERDVFHGEWNYTIVSQTPVMIKLFWRKSLQAATHAGAALKRR